MSIATEISRLTTLRNNIRTKLIALGIISDNSADLEDCYTAINEITAKSAATYTPTTSSQTISSGQYLSGAQTISGDANLVATNIAEGVTIFGVSGTFKGGVDVDITETADSHGGTVMTVSSENYGYQPIEWLKSTAGIDVGFQTKKTMEFECKFYRESAGAQYLYVSDSGSSLTTNTTAYLSSSGGNWRFGNQTTSPNPSVTTWHTSVQNSTGLKIDGTTVGTYGTMSSFTSTATLKIFSSVDSAVTRIQYLKVKDNGTLIHHFVPAKDLNTGKYGFFDAVSWGFYTNDSATISHGDDVSDPIIRSGVSKVNAFGTTVIDLTSDTVTAASMLSGTTAHNSAGNTITGTIATKTSSDLTASGATVTAPAGYYASSASKSVATGSATTPATTITSSPTITVSSAGLITATNNKTQSVTPTVSAGYVLSGTAGTITVNGSNTNQLSTQGATTYTPTTSDQTIASGKYLTGAQTIKGDANLVAANIADGVSIFGITGSHVGGLDINVTRVSDGHGAYKLQITNN